MLALFAAQAALAQQEPEGRTCGLLSVPAAQTPAGRELLAFSAGVLGWARPDQGPWLELSEQLGVPAAQADSAWRLAVGASGAIAPTERFDQSAGAQPYAFDLSFDLNELRSAMAQPFSRSGAGQVLDAIGIDNGRRARLAAIEDSSGEESLALVLFSESRSEPPGTWRPLRFASVRLAPLAGDAGGERPLEIDFGEQWEGVLVAIADAALAIDADPAVISRAERLEAWGLEHVAGLRALGAGLGARVRVWRAGDAGVVGAATLRRGVSERTLAANLRATLGPRLSWGRNSDGRALGTVSLGTARDSVEGATRLWVRFITIQDRVHLAVSNSEEALAGAPRVLASLAE